MTVPKMHDAQILNNVVPAKAGTQRRWVERRWIPAFAGMTPTLKHVVSHFGRAKWDKATPTLAVLTASKGGPSVPCSGPAVLT
jgi:hypothetical protein